MKIISQIGQFTRSKPALLVGLLIASAGIAAIERSFVPAVVQALCAAALACTIKH